MPGICPIQQNPLQSRGDVVLAMRQILEPAMNCFTEGFAGLDFGAAAAHYGSDAARVEGFARMLWGLAPLWAAPEDEGTAFAEFRQGLVNGANPDHPAYWGEVQDCDQKIVEMASIALLLLLIPQKLSFSPEEKKNLHGWLSQVNRRKTPLNNWLFFRILVNAAFRKMDLPWDKAMVEADFQRLDSYYIGGGWYFDGEPHQFDYYVSFALHFYGLIYARFMQDEDPARCTLIRERAAAFAKDFVYWFDDGGMAVPMGRSLTYRFAQCCFFSALAFADVEALPWGVVKSRVLGNLRWWFKQPIWDAGGRLTVGYAYPNLFMSENYNAPGSPYWALKSFLCLAVPPEHPFWTSEETPPQLDGKKALHEPQLLLYRDGTQIQMFPAGLHCVNQLGNCSAKYEKLCYSTSFGFSVSRGNSLEEGAFDNCLAVAEAGTDNYRMQRGFLESRFYSDHIWRSFSPLPGVRVEVTVTPDFPAHRREYRIVTERAIDVADGGFAIPAEHEGRLYTADMVRQRDGEIVADFPWGLSAIRCESGGGCPLLVKAYPNTNVLHPLTRIPTLCFRLEPGEHRIVTVVTGSVPKNF